MTPVERILRALEARDCNPRPAGKGWVARCPSHDDKRPSLSVGVGDDGRVLLCCHAGCKPDAICAALGLKLADLMPDDGRPKGNGKASIVATYDYRDERGDLLYQVVRFEPKDFRQRRPDGQGGWSWSVRGAQTVPYRLPELLAADAAEPVFVAEGEKDCDNLARAGVVATCNAGGAGKWTAEHAAFLRGRRVVVLPDNDAPGRRHAQQVAASLQGVAMSVRVVELPGLPEKGDVSDWLSAGGTQEELLRLVQDALEWTPEAEPWPELIRFDEQELPDFPAHALPDELRWWVEAESHATQTPQDLAGLLALATCAATIARRVEVEPRPGWREPVNLFVAVLLEPGNRKSAVFADATAPLRAVEAEVLEDSRPTVARAQCERRQAEARLRKLEKLAAEKGDADAGREAGNLAAELAEQLEPVLPRLIVDDATAEKLGMMLAEQGGRIASMSAEGGVFDLMAGLYSRNGTPQFCVYLMGHSGDALITDRVGRKSVRVERPALTCAYTMQPAVLAALAGNLAFRGRGLLARFLYAVPRSWIGRREIATAPVPDDVREAYWGVVRRLAANGGSDEPVVLRLAPDAEGRLRAWEAEIEDMLADGGQLESIRDWGGKLAGATLRLAAVLHCVEHGPQGCIEPRTMAAAVEIARYLIPHADAVLNMMEARTETADDDAQYVLRWIRRHGFRAFTKTEAQHHGKRRFPKADDIDAALKELERRGYIRPRPVTMGGIGRPASPSYEVNPASFEMENAEKRSQYSQNSVDTTAPPPGGGNYGNIGSAFERFETQERAEVEL